VTGVNVNSKDAYVRFSDVQKSYDGETLVVKNLNLDIGRGEFLTLLGPSGSGKTTCLMMLAGFETATHGQIILDGEPINNVAPHHRGIGMVFQNYALFPHMTVFENVAFPLQVRNRPKAEIEERVKKTLGMVRMGEFGSRRPAQLSGGQQQRIAVARALVFEPKLVLMDEPLSNLDAKLRSEIRTEIKDLNRHPGITVVYVTHDQSEALSMSDKVLLMEAGEAVQCGTPVELYSAPASIGVARFIGTPAMNVLAGTVAIAADGGRSAKIGGGHLPIDDSWSSVEDGQDVQVGVRPEHLRMGEEGMAITLVSVEWLGHEQILAVETAAGSLNIRSADDDPRVNLGIATSVTCDADAVHLFDAETGERLPQHQP